MALRAARKLVLFLWLVRVVVGQDGWSVTYTTQSVCALKGSTVDLSCSYTCPKDHIAKKLFWFNKWTINEPEDLIEDRTYAERVKYIPFKDNSGHTLKITDLNENDSATYWFRFWTNKTGWKYTGKQGVHLSVTELQVEAIHAPVTEGQTFTLTCKSTCNVTGKPTYVWYKNGQHLTNPKTQTNYLHLDRVTSEDSGRYSCAVKGHEDIRSTEENLTVRFRPKNTSVSVSTFEIVKGSSVTLTCSSDANPPVDKYTWYNKNVTLPKASGQSYSITNITSEDSGEYYCEVQNEIGSENSTAVMVIVAVKSSISGNQPSFVTTVAGVTVFVLVLILCFSGFMWFRMKCSKPTPSKTNKADSGQVDPNSIYANVLHKDNTPTVAQTTATNSEQWDSVYANISKEDLTTCAKAAADALT
ncbi:hypothetical protein UPYG_G00060540 [Umbra pygmaea]|uniref:Ig-like domain-containing protein n=1 Tax=Umbra pygmaea TaxID=75934 RepID=A0ABD0X984_UMBPY